MRWKLTALAIGALLLSTATVHVQPNQGVTVIGPVTPGNCAAFSSTTVLQDGGACAGSNGITALTGDVTATGPGSAAATLATVNANVGAFGSATQVGQVTVNAKGLVTAATNVTVTPAVSSITGLGTGVAAFLATPSSANLATAVTGETGTGALVFGTAPALASPALSGTVTGNNTVPLTILSQAAANTMVGNWTGSTANEVANAMPSCPDTGTNHLNYVSGTGVTCGTSAASGAGGSNTQVQYNNAGVLAGITGATSNGTSMTLASPVLSGTVTGNNTVPLTILSQAAANTMVGNWTGSTANEVANAMPSCPDTAGSHLNYVSGTGVTCGTKSPRDLLATLTASTSFTLEDTTHITSAYSTYELVFTNVIPTTSATQLSLQVHSGGSFQTTTYAAVLFVSNTSPASGTTTSTTFIPISSTDTVSTTSSGGVNGTVRLYGASGTASSKHWSGIVSYSSTVFTQGTTGGFWGGGQGALDGFRVYYGVLNTDTIKSGTIELYGLL